MVDMVCERADGVCNLCGADPEEDCPLTDLSPELVEWAERYAPTVVIIDPLRDILDSDEPAEWLEGPVVTLSVINEPGTISDNDECESCQ